MTVPTPSGPHPSANGPTSGAPGPACCGMQRWLKSGLLLAGIASLTAIGLFAGLKASRGQTVRALLYFQNQSPRHPWGEEGEYQKSARKWIAVVRSRRVLDVALRDPEIARLPLVL